MNLFHPQSAATRKQVRRWVSVGALALMAVGACTTSASSPDRDISPATTVANNDGSIGGQAVPVPSTDGQSGDLVLSPVYTADFESVVGPEWSMRSTFFGGVNKESILGRFGNEDLELRLNDLPTHEVVTVAFDLHLLGSWGLPKGDRWRLIIDQNQIINTTFSNFADSEQAYPRNDPLGASPGGTGAIELRSQSETGTDESVASRYRIERTFLHNVDELLISMSGRELESPDGQSWGIDNVEISVGAASEERARTNLIFDVVDGRIAVSGQAPATMAEDVLAAALELSFPGEVDAIEVRPIRAPPPLWLYSIGEISGHMQAFHNHTLTIDETSAEVVGSVRTERWRSSYGGQLSSILGPQVGIEVSLQVTLDSEVVSEVEAMRLFFASGSSSLAAEHRDVLDRLAALLDENPLLVVRVDGHTDSLGERGENRDLSLDRAEAARSYLVSIGADSNRLDLRAAGEVDLATDEAGPADRAVNRRVTFAIPQG